MAAHRTSTPLEPTCRLPAHRPVPNYYSCLQTFISWDGQHKRLHTRWANRGSTSTQEWTWIYSWWKEPVHAWAPRLPSSSPENRHLWRHSIKIIIIALPFQAATTCVMIAFVALPPNPPTHSPISPCPISFGCNRARWGRVHSLHFLWGCVERCLAAAAQFASIPHKQSVSMHHPHCWGQSTDSQLWHSRWGDEFLKKQCVEFQVINRTRNSKRQRITLVRPLTNRDKFVKSRPRATAWISYMTESW